MHHCDLPDSSSLSRQGKNKNSIHSKPDSRHQNYNSERLTLSQGGTKNSSGFTRLAECHQPFEILKHSSAFFSFPGILFFGGLRLWVFYSVLCGCLGAVASIFGKLALDFHSDAPFNVQLCGNSFDTSTSHFASFNRAITEYVVKSHFDGANDAPEQEHLMVKFCAREDSNSSVSGWTDLFSHICTHCEYMYIRIWGITKHYSSSTSHPDDFGNIWCFVSLLNLGYRFLALGGLIVSNVCMINLHMKALAKSDSAAYPSVCIFATNFIASVVLSHIVFNDAISLIFLLGSFCMLSGVYLIATAEPIGKNCLVAKSPTE